MFQETGNTKALSECFRCQKIGADYFEPDSFRLKLKAGSSYSNFLIDTKSGKRKVDFANVAEVLQPKIDWLLCKNSHTPQSANCRRRYSLDNPHTLTTKRHINSIFDALGANAHVFSRDYTLYVNVRGGLEQVFFDGYQVDF